MNSIKFLTLYIDFYSKKKRREKNYASLLLALFCRLNKVNTALPAPISFFIFFLSVNISLNFELTTEKMKEQKVWEGGGVGGGEGNKKDLSNKINIKVAKMLFLLCCFYRWCSRYWDGQRYDY